MHEDEIQRLIPQIAKGTRFYSGAELEELVIRAKRKFFESSESALSEAHLLDAANDFHIDANERKAVLERYAHMGQQFANSCELLRQLAEDDD